MILNMNASSCHLKSEIPRLQFWVHREFPAVVKNWWAEGLSKAIHNLPLRNNCSHRMELDRNDFDKWLFRWNLDQLREDFISTISNGELQCNLEWIFFLPRCAQIWDSTNCCWHPLGRRKWITRSWKACVANANFRSEDRLAEYTAYFSAG